MQDTEIFLPIKGYEGIYEISNQGRVKSLDRIDCRGQRRGKIIMRLSNDSDGYQIVSLAKERKKLTHKVHRLVAQAFIPPIDGKNQINHLDGDKKNNHVKNLMWCTNQENQAHSRETGLHPEIAETHKCATLTNEQVLNIVKETGSHIEVAKKYNTNPLIVCRIKIGKTWGSVTGIVYKQKKHIK